MGRLLLMKNVKMSIQRQSKMAMAILPLLEENEDTVIVMQMPRGWLLVAL